MLELSQKTKYALTLLTFLDKQDNGIFLPLKLITNHTGLPYRFLSMIAVNLKDAHILGSKEGKGGGYYLIKKLDQISLKNLVEAVDKPVGLVACQTGKYCGAQNYCQNKNKWDEIRDAVSQILDKYKVSDLN